MQFQMTHALQLLLCHHERLPRKSRTADRSGYPPSSAIHLTRHRKVGEGCHFDSHDHLPTGVDGCEGTGRSNLTLRSTRNGDRSAEYAHCLRQRHGKWERRRRHYASGPRPCHGPHDELHAAVPDAPPAVADGYRGRPRSSITKRTHLRGGSCARNPSDVPGECQRVTILISPRSVEGKQTKVLDAERGRRSHAGYGRSPICLRGWRRRRRCR
jgi:hypothetical protein